jgi:hypothetical protein
MTVRSRVVGPTSEGELVKGRAAGARRGSGAARNLDTKGLRDARTWDLHVLPRLGDLRLRDVTLPVCQRFAADLARDGVGAPTRDRALVLLGSVMQRAVAWQHVTVNPVRAVRKPVQRREREIRPLAPARVETLRSVLGPRDATLSRSSATSARGRPRHSDCAGRTSENGTAAGGGRNPTRTWRVRSRRVPSPERRPKPANCEAPHMQGFRESRRPDSNRGPLHYE